MKTRNLMKQLAAIGLSVTSAPSPAIFTGPGCLEKSTALNTCAIAGPAAAIPSAASVTATPRAQFRPIAIVRPQMSGTLSRTHGQRDNR